MTRSVRFWAPRVLGTIRLVNGAAGLFLPRLLSRRLGVDPEANTAPVYPLRMFGVRTIVLGIELLSPYSDEALDRSLQVGVVIHASDTVAAALGGLRGELPARTALLLTGLSAFNTATAVVGSLAVRQKGVGRRTSRRFRLRG